MPIQPVTTAGLRHHQMSQDHKGLRDLHLRLKRHETFYISSSLTFHLLWLRLWSPVMFNLPSPAASLLNKNSLMDGPSCDHCTAWIFLMALKCEGGSCGGSATLECTRIKMPRLFYCLSISLCGMAFFRETSVWNSLHIPVMQSSVLMHLFLLNSCSSVIERFIMGLSHDGFYLEKNYLLNSPFVLYNATRNGWDSGMGFFFFFHSQNLCNLLRRLWEKRGFQNHSTRLQEVTGEEKMARSRSRKAVSPLARSVWSWRCCRCQAWCQVILREKATSISSWKIILRDRFMLV